MPLPRARRIAEPLELPTPFGGSRPPTGGRGQPGPGDLIGAQARPQRDGPTLRGLQAPGGQVGRADP